MCYPAFGDRIGIDTTLVKLLDFSVLEKGAETEPCSRRQSPGGAAFKVTNAIMVSLS